MIKTLKSLHDDEWPLVLEHDEDSNTYTVRDGHRRKNGEIHWHSTFTTTSVMEALKRYYRETGAWIPAFPEVLEKWIRRRDPWAFKDA